MVNAVQAFERIEFRLPAYIDLCLQAPKIAEAPLISCGLVPQPLQKTEGLTHTAPGKYNIKGIPGSDYLRDVKVSAVCK